MTRHLPVIDATLKPPPSTPGEALYVAPAPNGQGRLCSNCVLWVAPEERCIIHDRLLPVKSSQVCGYHLFGRPLPQWVELPKLERVQPETSGLIFAPPRGTMCANCAWYGLPGAGLCGRVASEIRDDGSWVPAEVHAAGCCAQWAPPERK